MRNRKIFVYGSVAAIVLIAAIVVLLLHLFPIKKVPDQIRKEGNMELFKAVPSDAIMVCDFRSFGDFINAIGDTSSIGVIFNGSINGMFSLQKKMVESDLFSDSGVIYSLHYSSKNKISFLQIADLPDALLDKVSDIIRKKECSSRAYIDAVIYSTPDSINLSIYKHKLLLSSSASVLESSIRHLDNGNSILDNPEFRRVITMSDADNTLYLRNSQAGKIFSGVIGRGAWKYADFFQKFASWSIYGVSESSKAITLTGSFLNTDSDASQSYVFSGQKPAASGYGEILPCNAVFVTSISISDIKSYRKSYMRFLEANKRLQGYLSKIESVSKKGRLTPVEWADTIKIQEVVSALCLDDGQYKWITALRTSSSYAKKLMGASGIIEYYPYKHYVASLFGGLFDNCNEESFIKRDSWIIIGPRALLSKISSEEYLYVPLKEYLSQTNASDFLSRESVAKVLINISDNRDSIAKNILPYIGTTLSNKTFDKNNVVLLTANITNGESGPGGEISLLVEEAKNIARIRTQKRKKSGNEYVEEIKFKPHVGPYLLKDFVNGGNCTLTQNQDNSLAYTLAGGKTNWTIAFPSKLAGKVVQADLYKNKKLQMIFVSGNKLYALDRLGRFVEGYPISLQKKVAFGPELYDVDGNKTYLVSVINTDNTISVYNIGGGRPKGWRDIEAGEPVLKLPELWTIGSKKFWVVRTTSQTRIYAFNGVEITGKKRRREIDTASRFKFMGTDEIGVKCVDGKEYILNLKSSEFKKKR